MRGGTFAKHTWWEPLPRRGLRMGNVHFRVRKILMMHRRWHRRRPNLIVELWNDICAFEMDSSVYGCESDVLWAGLAVLCGFFSLLLDMTRNFAPPFFLPVVLTHILELLKGRSENTHQIPGYGERAQTMYLRTYTARARRLAVAPRSHPVAMITGAAHSSFDRHNRLGSRLRLNRNSVHSYRRRKRYGTNGRKGDGSNVTIASQED